MSNCNWIVSDYINETICNRCYEYLPQNITITPFDENIILENNNNYEPDTYKVKVKKLLSLNSRFRFYKYNENDYKKK